MIRNSRLRVEPLEDRLAPAAAGSLDPTFGGGDGIAPAPSGTLTVLPDGGSLALDLVRSEAGTFSFAIQRLGPDGSPDPTYGTNGVANVTRVVETFSVVTPLPDGSALFAGALFRSSDTDIAVIRVTADGVVDTTFGAGGVAVAEFDAPGEVTSDYPRAVLVQPDGRILVVGDRARGGTLDGVPIFAGDLAAARLTADGKVDPSFGNGGTAAVSFPVGRFDWATASEAALQPDGRIVIGGSAGIDGRVSGRVGPYGFYSYWAIGRAPVAVRLTADGKLDPTFGDGGRVRVAVPDGRPSTEIAAVQGLADGRVLLVTDGAVATRLTADGKPDPTYGTGGVAFATGGNATIDSQGRVVAIGGRGVLTRLTADGLVDGRFGTGGEVNVYGLLGFEYPDSVYYPTLATLSDGRIVVRVKGSAPLAPPEEVTDVVVRFLGDGEPPGFVPTVAGTIAVGGANGGGIEVLNPTGGAYAAAGSLTIYDGFVGNVRTATADVNGDGVPDYVTGVGPGGPPGVTVFDGATGNLVADWLAFESGFTGGVFVTAADLDGDGRAEVVATADQGGGARVVIFSVAGGAATMRASFFGIDDPNFRGGARATLGDVNNDGTPDLAVAAGFLGGPRVALFDGTTLFGTPTRILNDFFAFPGEDATTLRNGVFVAAGDVNGDGFAELIFGGGPGGAPRVFVLSGALIAAGDVAGAQASPVANFFVADNSSDRGGVRVAITDADGDANADLAVGSGEGAPANVRVYLGRNVTTVAEPGTFQDLSVFGGAVLPGGVFVG